MFAEFVVTISILLITVQYWISAILLRDSVVKLHDSWKVPSCSITSFLRMFLLVLHMMFILIFFTEYIVIFSLAPDWRDSLMHPTTAKILKCDYSANSIEIDGVNAREKMFILSLAYLLFIVMAAWASEYIKTRGRLSRFVAMTTGGIGVILLWKFISFNSILNLTIRKEYSNGGYIFNEYFIVIIYIAIMSVLLLINYARKHKMRIDYKKLSFNTINPLIYLAMFCFSIAMLISGLMSLQRLIT